MRAPRCEARRGCLRRCRGLETRQLSPAACAAAPRARASRARTRPARAPSARRAHTATHARARVETRRESGAHVARRVERVLLTPRHKRVEARDGSSGQSVLAHTERQTHTLRGSTDTCGKRQVVRKEQE
eukprot:1991032-Pleurochrysis_carterae.AAC.2